MRQAEIVAGLFGLRAFLAETGLALQQRWLGRIQREVQCKVCGRNSGGEAARCIALKPPVIQHDTGIALRRLGQAKARARDPLSVQQMADCGVGQCGVGKQNLARRKLAGVGSPDTGPAAEEGHLKCQVLALGRLQPAGEVPPFGAEIRVRAVVARQHDGHAGPHLRHRLRPRAQGCAAQQQAQAKTTEASEPHYQSSRTARTASDDKALRPATTAVSAEASTKPSHSAANKLSGHRVSMVQ